MSTTITAPAVTIVVKKRRHGKLVAAIVGDLLLGCHARLAYGCNIGVLQRHRLGQPVRLAVAGGADGLLISALRRKLN